MAIYLGDLSITEFEKRAGIELTVEQRNTLNSMLEHTCADVQGNNKIHIYGTTKYTSMTFRFALNVEIPTQGKRCLAYLCRYPQK